MKQLLWCILLALTFNACGYKAENEALKSEITKLKNQITQQSEELEKYKYDPAKLLAEAKSNFNQRKFDAVFEINKQIAKYHPSAKEKSEIESLCTQIREIKKKEAEIVEKEKKRKKEERLASVRKLKKKYDDVSGNTWYEQPYFVHYDNINAISSYIGKNDTQVWLRLKMSYEGEDWIFFEEAYLSYDGNTKQIFFNKYKDKKTDNSSTVWEWIDVLVDDDLYTYLCNYVKGKDVKMRLSGKYTKTRKLNKNEIKGLKDVLTAYDVLKKEMKK